VKDKVAVQRKEMRKVRERRGRQRMRKRKRKGMKIRMKKKKRMRRTQEEVGNRVESETQVSYRGGIWRNQTAGNVKLIRDSMDRRQRYLHFPRVAF
jgi:predicted PilT family ATPase